MISLAVGSVLTVADLEITASTTDHTAESLVLQGFVCFPGSSVRRVFALDSWTQTKVKVIERNDT
jgi:hypothetical protein